MPHVAYVARVEDISTARHDRYMRVADILRTRSSTKLSHGARLVIERRDGALQQCFGKLCLSRRTSPCLSQRRTRNHYVGAAHGCELQHRPKRAVVALQRNQSARVQYDGHVGRRPSERAPPFGRTARRRCLRSAERSSASVSAPCSRSHSSTARNKPSARSFRRAASANQLDVGSRPAARRTARASSGSSEIAKRLTVILRYYSLCPAGQGGLAMQSPLVRSWRRRGVAPAWTRRVALAARSVATAAHVQPVRQPIPRGIGAPTSATAPAQTAGSSSDPRRRT
jgi:hypothetical protein